MRLDVVSSPCLVPAEWEQYLCSPDAWGIFGMFVHEREDMTLALVFVQLVDVDEDAGLFHFAELMVDGGSEDKHRRRKVHIGVHQWGYVATALAHFGIEDTIVELEIVLYKEFAKLTWVTLNEQGLVGAYHVAVVAKVLVKEIEYHVARQAVVGWVHGHFPKEVFGIVKHDGERGKPIKKIIKSK